MPRRPDVPCAGGCGTLLWRGRGSLPSGQATCRSCRASRRALPAMTPVRAVLLALPARECPACGRPFAPQRRDQRTCSAACSRSTAGRPRTPCEVCGTPFAPRGGRKPAQRTCSRVCGGRISSATRAARPKPPPTPARPQPSCRACGKVRSPGEHWRSWCSYSCELRSRGDRVIDLYQMASARGMGGARWRRLLVGYLRERDGNRCGICRGAIRFDLPSGPSGDDRGPSVDHIEPRSLGGSDDLANLRLTHWGCNRKRRTGRRGEVVQLALIG